MAKHRPALGRGLSALIPDKPAPPPGLPTEVDIDQLTPNRVQPRTVMDEPQLEELAASIRRNGVIQPIVVRPGDPGRFEIVAGERRWRAAQRAGLLRVPVVVRNIPDDKLLEVALVENLQRENLNPIEEAEAYRRLTTDYGLTQEAVAAAVGKNRATVANYVRLLGLPPELQADVAGGALTMGHARALLGLSVPGVQKRAAREVVGRGLSVRDTEDLVKKLTRQGEPTAPPSPPAPDVHTRAAQDRLRVALGTRVRIVRRGRQGRIEIAFTSEDELQRLFERLTGS
ncbi:MAG: ParB/RepB/Spo0J family partition protein [Acidobacteria bacterium]|nr:ParB/RepB/Spo0J family partition protein [Acidobacteriota bacterium]